MNTRSPNRSRTPGDGDDAGTALERAAGRWATQARRAALMASYRINEESGRLEMAWATPPGARYRGCVSAARRKGWWQPEDEAQDSRVRVISLL